IGPDLIGYPTHPQDQAAQELQLAVWWGTEPLHAIVAGTKLGTEVLGEDKQKATTQAGEKANLRSFDGNSLDDITVLQPVNFVMKDGQLVKFDTKRGKKVYGS